MKRRRVKITGIGPVTPAGIGRGEFWKGILEPISRVQPFTKLGDEYGPFLAAYVDKFQITKYADRERLPKGIGRHAQFAAAGALLALADAQLTIDALPTANTLVVTGSSLMDFGGISTSTSAVFRKGPGAALGRTVFTTTNANVTESVSQVLGISPRTMTLQNSCCSGLDAIGYAAAAVSRGEVEIAICGGTEAPLHQCPLLEMRAAGLTPPTTDMPERMVRPFDLWRTTGVVAEGACMFILEPEHSPRPAYALISGYGFANDPDGDVCGGLLDAARLAMADARIKKEQVDAISAWGPGHRVIDAGECRAMRHLFGGGLSEIPAGSIKASVGSALGAAPAIQVGAAALGLYTGILPPTVNWEYPDPECPLNLCKTPRAIDHRVNLVNAHGIGSVNCCVILEKW